MGDSAPIGREPGRAVYLGLSDQPGYLTQPDGIGKGAELKSLVKEVG